MFASFNKGSIFAVPFAKRSLSRKEKTAKRRDYVLQNFGRDSYKVGLSQPPRYSKKTFQFIWFFKKGLYICTPLLKGRYGLGSEKSKTD
jgi:hypothetical protein